MKIRKKIRKLLETSPEERCKGYILGLTKWFKCIFTSERFLNVSIRLQRLEAVIFHGRDHGRLEEPPV